MNRRTWLRLVLLPLLLACCAFGWADCPYNGGFEYLDKGLPLGWDLEGTWLSLNPGAQEGRRAIYLAGTVARAGDRLISQGYRLASPGDTLTLHLAYIAERGGALVGLLPCDALGQPLGEAVLAVGLPEASSWRTVAQDILLPAESCPEGTGSVRVVLGTDRSGEEVRYDAVNLTGPTAASTAGGYRTFPAIDAFSRPNLLTNPEFSRTAGGTLPGWRLMGLETGEARPPLPPNGGLSLVAGDLPVAWLSEAVRIDVSLPYECSLKLAESQVAVPGLQFLARIRDAADPQAVWLQVSRAGPTDENGELMLSLPRLFLTPRAGLIEVAVAARPGCGESATVVRAALRPQPVTLGIRPVAMMGDFARSRDVALFISAINNTLRGLQPMAYMKVFDGQGKVAYYEPRAVKISARSAGYFPLKPKLPGAGDYRLLVRLMEKGQDLGSTTYAFRVLEG